MDKVVGYVAPVLLGSGRWPVRAAGPASESMADAIRLEIAETTRLGDDLRITAYPQEQGADVFTGIVEELGTRRRGQDLGDAARLTVPARS